MLRNKWTGWQLRISKGWGWMAVSRHHGGDFDHFE